ncbi:MAG: iron chaperone [Myxococcaceae bacterium]
MPSAKSKPRIVNFAEYLASQPPRSRAVLRKIRALVRSLVPDAEETISYHLPAFRRGRIFFYFAAFKSHIGIYPPARGNPALLRALAKHRTAGGNLRFPLDAPLSPQLLARVIKALAKPYAKRALSKKAHSP